ncbi:hypothetical protein CEXT_608731 [Caerostris extrusa]|uniref:Uncharacterized protein n=1 Tax=Caerostris extrusa TaxID=172846 RepID=A0AAV4R6Q4_CAEEX|nr:hypothetical protein CEXT_608731 [Caerostris extrusa]
MHHVCVAANQKSVVRNWRGFRWNCGKYLKAEQVVMAEGIAQILNCKLDVFRQGVARLGQMISIQCIPMHHTCACQSEKCCSELLTSGELWEIFESRAGGHGRRNCSDFRLQSGCLQTGCGEIGTDCLEHKCGNVLITIVAELLPLSDSCLINS